MTEEKNNNKQQSQQSVHLKQFKKSVDNTIFVRFTPPCIDTLRRHHVEDLFSEIGPIKKSSVIHNIKSNISYGFVKYMTQKDADIASKRMNHRTIRVLDPDTNKSIDIIVKVELAKNVDVNDNKSSDKNQTNYRKPNPAPPKTQNDLKSSIQTVVTPPDDHNELDIKKRNRLMIRNLSFYAKENDVRNAIEPIYGKLIEIHIPKVPGNNSNNKKDGYTTTHRGFCFITFENDQSTKKCLADQEKAINNIIIKERNVTISKSLHKTAYTLRKQDDDIKIPSLKKTNQKSLSHVNNDDDLKTNKKRKKSDEDELLEVTKEMESSASDHGKDNNDVNDDEDDDDDDDDKDDSDDDDDDDDEEDQAEGETSSTRNKDKELNDDEKKKDKKFTNHDHTAVSERRCLFIRNLPFDCTRYDLFEIFRKYGHITSIYIVKETNGLPTGRAFVSYDSIDNTMNVLNIAKVIETEKEKIEETTTTSTTTTSFVSQKMVSVKDDTTKNQSSQKDSVTVTGDGIYCKGRQLLLDLAVDKETATTLTLTSDDDVKGQDRRNLYLLTEGRIENNEKLGKTDWDDLLDTDQLKRQTAWSEKHTKLKSPLFFINPIRVSIRNLAKHITEQQVKQLCCIAVQKGMKLVSTQDQINHWRATGTLSTREILERLRGVEEQKRDGNNNNKNHDELLPTFDENNLKRYIPSVFISKNIISGQNKNDSSSRGFGFIEFTHHIHALALLRELNNNPIYSEEYAAGGKKAANDLKHGIVRKKKPITPKANMNKKNRLNPKKHKMDDKKKYDDTIIRIPRLIVDFAVENKAKSKHQLEHRIQQHANMLKQQHEVKESKKHDNNNSKKDNKIENSNNEIKKTSRGAIQREKKRKQRQLVEEENNKGPSNNVNMESHEKHSRSIVHDHQRGNDNSDDDSQVVMKDSNNRLSTTRNTASNKSNIDHDDILLDDDIDVSQPKNKKFKNKNKNNSSIDQKEEEQFNKLVESYKERFQNLSTTTSTAVAAGVSDKKKDNSNDAIAADTPIVKSRQKKRWFE